MRKYAVERTSILLRRMAFRMHRAARLHHADSIHDLRVSVRRFQQCLRVFQQFFPGGAVKKIHKRLHMVMELSGEVRNRDIALYLLRKAGPPPDSALSAVLLEQKKHAQNELSRLLRRWGRRDVSRKWRSRLRLR
ncbi:MAG TPA: CHAD domain-containing protein [Bryobacteraceae bacterium]|nr:CHAD domain-containing protein [Bryobacteraceae bacterium]